MRLFDKTDQNAFIHEVLCTLTRAQVCILEIQYKYKDFWTLSWAKESVTQIQWHHRVAIYGLLFPQRPQPFNEKYSLFQATVILVGWVCLISFAQITLIKTLMYSSVHVQDLNILQNCKITSKQTAWEFISVCSYWASVSRVLFLPGKISALKMFDMHSQLIHQHTMMIFLTYVKCLWVRCSINKTDHYYCRCHI